MAITIDWGSKIIHVPKDFLDVLQLVPTEIYNLPLNAFRMALKDLEDSEEGMVFLDTHRHNTEVLLGGLTYARVVEIINGYTITFEDGQYAVNLIGANTNAGDVVNVNQVSIRVNNSAGMITSAEIQYAAFDHQVAIDIDNGTAGTIYPQGTPLAPVNNLADALAIAVSRGFNMLKLMSNMTLASGDNVDYYHIISDTWPELTIEPGASVIYTEFTRLSLYGAMCGSWNILNDCWAYDISNFRGWVRSGSFVYIELSPYTEPDPMTYGSSYFDNIVPMYTNTPSVVVGNTNVAISFTNACDLYEIRSLTAGSVLSMGLDHGQLTVDSSCVGGTIIVSGIGKTINNSTLVVDRTRLVNAEHTAFSLFNNGITIDPLNGVDSADMLAGTPTYPVQTCEFAMGLAEAQGFKIIYFINDFTISSHTMSGYTVIGLSPRQTNLTIDNILWAGGGIQNCSVEGIFADNSFVDIRDCEIGNLSNIRLTAYNCELAGIIGLNDSGATNFYGCVDGIPGSGYPVVQVNDTLSLGFWGYFGGIGLVDMALDTQVSMNLSSGRLVLAASCTNGDVIIRGIGALVDNSVGTVVSSTGLLSNPAITADVFAKILSGSNSRSFEQIMEIITSAMAGKSSGGGTTNIKFRNLEDAADVIDATVDENGNRSNVSLNV